MNRLLLFTALFSLPILALASPTIYYPGRTDQGDTLVVKIYGGIPTAAYFDGEAASLFPYQDSYRAVFAIPATKPAGQYNLSVSLGGKTETGKISVRAKKFPLVVLGIPEKLDLTPTTLVEKLQTEKVDLDKIFEQKTPNVFFSQSFGLPLADNRRLGSVFGEIRQTGDTQIRHLGTDFSARKGAAIGAINAGVVRKAYFDQVYGNSVILDHGAGIFSFYLHLNEIRAKEGDVLERGSLVGTVGDTGYAEGAHLHLSIKIGGVSVDPIGFVKSLR